FAHLQLAAPGSPLAEVQADARVRVVDARVLPRLRIDDVDAQLLVQLARQRGDDRLAALELAARKLPPAGVHLARRPRREQEAPAPVDQDADGDVDDPAAAFAGGDAHAWRPA